MSKMRDRDIERQNKIRMKEFKDRLKLEIKYGGMVMIPHGNLNKQEDNKQW